MNLQGEVALAGVEAAAHLDHLVLGAQRGLRLKGVRGIAAVALVRVNHQDGEALAVVAVPCDRLLAEDGRGTARPRDRKRGDTGKNGDAVTEDPTNPRRDTLTMKVRGIMMVLVLIMIFSGLNMSRDLSTRAQGLCSSIRGLNMRALGPENPSHVSSLRRLPRSKT